MFGDPDDDLAVPHSQMYHCGGGCGFPEGALEEVSARGQLQEELGFGPHTLPHGEILCLRRVQLALGMSRPCSMVPWVLPLPNPDPKTPLSQASVVLVLGLRQLWAQAPVLITLGGGIRSQERPGLVGL